jgi:hypothetical protein
MSTLVSLCLIYLVKHPRFNIVESNLPEYFVFKYNVYKLIFETLDFNKLIKIVKRDFPIFSIIELIDVWNYKHYIKYSIY